MDRDGDPEIAPLLTSEDREQGCEDGGMALPLLALVGFFVLFGLYHELSGSTDAARIAELADQGAAVQTETQR